MNRDDFLEQSYNLENEYKENAKYVRQLVLDAFDAHAEIKDASHIIYKIDELSTVNPNYYGLFISIYKEFIAVWIAIEDGSGVRDGMSINDYPIDISFKDLVSKCKADLDKCPICKKKVGLAKMNRYSFAGRCCPDCLPEMRKQYEQPGWYN